MLIAWGGLPLSWCTSSASVCMGSIVGQGSTRGPVSAALHAAIPRTLTGESPDPGRPEARAVAAAAAHRRHAERPAAVVDDHPLRRRPVAADREGGGPRDAAAPRRHLHLE